MLRNGYEMDVIVNQAPGKDFHPKAFRFFLYGL